MNIADDIYLGTFSIGSGLLPVAAGSADPTVNSGVGPMGRISIRGKVPLTLGVANVAALQHMTNGTSLTLAAATGTTLGSAPDGSGRPVIVFDVERCPSLTSTANLSGINFLATGFDEYGRLQTSLLAGPSNNTVHFTKAFQSVLSIVPNTTDGTDSVSAGTSDVFGLPFACFDAGMLMPKWAGALALDAGTLVTADTTSPATSSTGDPAGTYATSSASNGANQLFLWQHLNGNQCGPQALVTQALGVTPA